MGQKINPISLRLGKLENWRSRWFFDKTQTKIWGKNPYAKILAEDELIRKIIKEKISQAGIISVEIERISGMIKIFIKASRPGLIIGRGGKGIEDLTKLIEKKIIEFRKSNKINDLQFKLSLNIEELKRGEVAASYIAEQIALDMQKRIPYRLTVKKHLDYLRQHKDVKGAKIKIKGRLDGNEIARRETFKFGSLPSNNLRAKIDYAKATSFNTYGTVGVHVWIYKGEVFDK